MRIAVLLSTYSRFDPRSATAVDLCVRDGWLNSRYRDETRIYGPKNDAPYPDIPYTGLDGYPIGRADRRSLAYVDAFITQIAETKPDLVVMQDDWRASGRLAARLKTPVIFHTHTYTKRRTGLDRMNRLRNLRRLAGMIFVSEDARRQFQEAWGSPCPLHIGLNGIDARTWRPIPQAERAREIAFIGRCVDWKGVSELIDALPPMFAAQPGWRARFVLTGLDQSPDYVAACMRKLGDLGERVIVETDAPHERVQAVCQSAAIGVTPSTRNESFSRVSMEFLAGGAALISSGVGGMREASGEAAIYCEPTPAALADTINRLIADEPGRASLVTRGRERTLNELDIRRTTAAIDDIYDATLRASKC